MLRADTTDRTLVAAGQQVCGDHGACAWPATQQINALTAASWCAGGARRSRDQRTFNFDHTAHRTGALWADSRRIMGDDAAWAARTRAQVSAWGPTTSAVVPYQGMSVRIFRRHRSRPWTKPVHACPCMSMLAVVCCLLSVVHCHVVSLRRLKANSQEMDASTTALGTTEWSSFISMTIPRPSVRPLFRSPSVCREMGFRYTATMACERSGHFFRSAGQTMQLVCGQRAATSSSWALIPLLSATSMYTQQAECGR